jgi:hypothetical protein
VGLPGFLDNWQMNVVRLSAKHTDYLHVPRDVLGTYSSYRLSHLQGEIAAERNKSIQ